MLGRQWRFHVQNGTGVNQAVTITARLYKFNSSGALVYSGEQTYSLGTISPGASWTNSATQNNDTDLYVGGELTVSVTPSGTANGLVLIQRQNSTDGGTTWPSDGAGEPVGSVSFSSSSAARVLNMEL